MTPNPLRYDPSRTGDIVRAAGENINRVFVDFSRLILAEVGEADTFGLGPVANRKHEFGSTHFVVTDPVVLAEHDRLQRSLDPRDVLKLEDKPHVTIRYGLHDLPDLVDRVNALLAGAGPVTVRVGRLSLFHPPGKGDVLKYDIDGPELERMNARLGLVPNTTTFAEYKPHITVAYLNEGTGQKYLEAYQPLVGTALTFTRLEVSTPDEDLEQVVLNAAWAPGAPREHVKAFRDWLRTLSRDVITSQGQEALWDQFTSKAYTRGAARSVKETEAKKPAPTPTKNPKVNAAIGAAQLAGKVQGVINRDKLAAATGRTFDEVKGLSQRLMTKLSRVLNDGIARGYAPRTVARMLVNEVGLERKRAMMIARTECLPAETPIDGAVVRAVFRRWYVGEMVEVVTRSGRKLSATPNHPMLTKQGWIAAGLLKVGDDVVCRRSDQGHRAGHHPDVDARPTTIGEVFNSLKAVGRLERRLGSRPDFHGDGREGEVDIFATDRELVVGRFSPLDEHGLKDILPPTYLRRLGACPKCGRLLSVDAGVCFCLRPESDAGSPETELEDTTLRPEIVCERSQGLPGYVPTYQIVNGDVGSQLVGHSPPLPGTLLGVGVGPGYPRGLDDLPATEPGEVELDGVVSVTLRQFAGHVYNLETSYGYYQANGLYTKNCIRAHAEGQLDALDALGETTVMANVEFLPSVGACPKCARLRGKVFTVKSARGVLPVHPNAVFAPSTFTPYGECQELVRARYRGPAVVLTLGGGRHGTTIGPNHPMMTRRGMVKAAELQEGDEVLYDLRHDKQPTGLYLEKVVTVKDAFQTVLGVTGYSGVVPSPSDLHGDRVFCQGEVQAVRPQNGLLPVRDSLGVEHFRQINLARTDTQLLLGSGSRSGLFAGESVSATSTCSVCGRSESLAVLGGSIAHPDVGGLGLGSEFDPPLLETFPHGVVLDTTLGGQVIYPFPSQVTADDVFVWKEIHGVSFTTYEGWAFDATTDSSLYCSDGFVVSNCKCCWSPAVGRKATGRRSRVPHVANRPAPAPQPQRTK